MKLNAERIKIWKSNNIRIYNTNVILINRKNDSPRFVNYAHYIPQRNKQISQDISKLLESLEYQIA